MRRNIISGLLLILIVLLYKATQFNPYVWIYLAWLVGYFKNVEIPND